MGLKMSSLNMTSEQLALNINYFPYTSLSGLITYEWGEKKKKKRKVRFDIVIWPIFDWKFSISRALNTKQNGQRTGA